MISLAYTSTNIQVLLASNAARYITMNSVGGMDAATNARHQVRKRDDVRSREIDIRNAFTDGGAGEAGIWAQFVAGYLIFSALVLRCFLSCESI